ncbi:RHS repeat-associated core domain-containing protein [Burkholderia plantarii]
MRFAGQYFDRETGLHYNRHRYYDPCLLYTSRCV